jgi:hypothetical protein
MLFLLFYNIMALIDNKKIKISKTDEKSKIKNGG